MKSLLDQSSPAEMRRIRKQVESALEACIKAKSCITYSDLGMQLDMNPRDGRLTEVIRLITIEDAKNNAPIRTALIVRKGTGMPGHAFFEYIQSTIGNQDWRKFWREEVAKLVDDRVVSIPL